MEIKEIGTAIGEESTAANQKERAVGELNQVTEQNPSLVEEIVSSSEAFNSEAQSLSDIVRSFKLKY